MVRSGLDRLLVIPAIAALAVLGATEARAEENVVYKVLRKFVDVDQEIAKATKIVPVSCVYDGIRGRVESSNGMGYCLYRAFQDARKTDYLPGVTRAKLKLPYADANEEPVEVTVYWRPVQSRLSDHWYQWIKGFKEYRKILTHYLENDIVIVSSEGIEWSKIVGPIGEIPGLLGREAQPKVRKIDATFEHGSAPNSRLVGTIRLYEELSPRPTLTFKIDSTVDLWHLKHVKTRVKGGTP